MRSALIIAAILLSGPALAQSKREHILPPADPKMILGFVSAQAMPMSEYVPAGENVNEWTRMVTVMQLPWRPGLTPAAFLERVKALWTRSCSNTTVGATSVTMIEGRGVAELRLNCPRNPNTNQPETMFARAMLGNEGMYMVQAAMRRSPTAADLAWARHVMTDTKLCETGSTDIRCSAPQASAIGTPL